MYARGDGSPVQDGLLIVSDDPMEMRRLGLALRPTGLRIIEMAANGARHDVMDQEVAVAVLDARQSAAVGLEAARGIRSHDGLTITPIVLIADGATAATSAMEALRLLGGVDVVPASVSSEELRSRVAVLVDVSAQNRALARLVERQRAVLDAQQAVVRGLAGGEPDDVVMPRMARTVALRLGWHVSAYWAPADFGAERVEMWFDPSFSPVERERLQAAAALGPPDGVVRRARTSGRPEWAVLSDRDGEEAYTRVAYEAGLVSILAVPVTVSSGTPGVIELLSRLPQPPDQQTLTLLTSVSTLIGRVLDARRSYDEAESLKNHFFALVSHELLTPLTSILGYVEELLIADPHDLNGQQRHDLEIVDRNARRLHRLVNDLILAAQIEAGKLSLELTTVDLAEVVREAVEAARSTASRRDVEIELHVAPVSAVHGDPKRLGQVVGNLVSNAVKFSHAGGRVQVVLEPAGGEAVIEVADRGIGIPSDERERVFERYFRSSIGMAKEIPGVGLGLSICKAIVEAHGGSILLGTDDGEGSTFRVTLPFEAPAVEGGLHHDPGVMR